MSDEVALFGPLMQGAQVHRHGKGDPGSLILSAVMMLEHMVARGRTLILRRHVGGDSRAVVTYDLARLMEREAARM